MKPMRMLILLAVTWAAGSLLFAAEWYAPSRRTPDTGAAQEKVAVAALAQSAPAESGQAAPTAGSEAPEAQNSSAGQEEQKQKETDAGAAPPTPASSETEADEEPLPPPPPSGERRDSPQRFVPSEQVRADFDVSFPIDI